MYYGPAEWDAKMRLWRAAEARKSIGRETRKSSARSGTSPP